MNRKMETVAIATVGITVVAIIVITVIFLRNMPTHPSDEANNSYGGTTHRQCEPPIAGGHCEAYVLDENGDVLCDVGIPRQRNEVKLEAITCENKSST